MYKVSIVDYGLGNIRAFYHIYQRLNIPVEVAATVEQLKSAQKLILPGVGAFDWAMNRLNDSGLRDVLDELVLNRSVPVLGVCVGMQMMASKSAEGDLAGLGWLDAEVVRFNVPKNVSNPLPHMGWNDVSPVEQETIFKDITSPRYYFLHSYCIRPAREENILSRTFYGEDFVSAVTKDNIFGTQFHPEKSHKWGIDLLRNFAEISQC
ncbi:imidazole glycerol phosphate synthase subunit HisH [Thalassospira indica]|uniref:Imidazole glycerol phosphate synthase subunit HisH n=1 Tax=Thalassospira indica TaxID=1891279 RepID=A0ABN5NBQ0_9PROT|nr:imidazole glycerol phosphate synthase subunit HisH [Thalassospira indica]AXO13638.1 imidazole glycerol phosphate synthase subunit HisH [Thalassospira indica]OAZ14479.1 imidazole glycerol phosphate synthase [Thalassospira profundimaris]